MNSLLLIIIALMILKTGVEIWLEFLNRKNVLDAANEVPAAYREFIDKETYEKSVAYTLAKNKLGIIETFYDVIILAIVLFSGVLPWLWQAFGSILGTGTWAQAATLFIIFTLLSRTVPPAGTDDTIRMAIRAGTVM